MRDLFILLWGAILASSWWGFGVASYNGLYLANWYFPFQILFVMLLLGSVLTVVFIIETVIVATYNSWESG